MGLPMHTDKTPFVLSPFWTSPPLLQMTGNSRPCKSMILDFTHLSHGSTCMLEVAQQLTPVSGIFLRDLSDTYENLIVVGDFSERHFSWDSAGANPNGRGLAEAPLDLDLHLFNTGEPSRLAERPGDTNSCIDLTLCSSDLQSRLTWKLISHVDSNHLLCEVRCRVRYANPLFKYKHPYNRCRKGNTVWNAIRNFAKSIRTLDCCSGVAGHPHGGMMRSA